MAIIKSFKPSNTRDKVIAGIAGATAEDPIDAVIIGAGPSASDITRWNLDGSYPTLLHASRFEV
ncbi:hypothetical protein N7492_004315 [Penicillium capsulatum]|uniref:Uncharacterized protein n=1 Tax=Penicillium capsulatum TaxID=69766 RepID=A0A9W9IDJ5_9EURO|nr:hypothetical protein N7492_004315 [Penicillium capsulatum]